MTDKKKEKAEMVDVPASKIEWFGEGVPEDSSLPRTRVDPREMVDAREWIATSGRASTRLQKIFSANLLAESMAVYREERMAAELGPGWEVADPKHVYPIRNPSEADLDALADAPEGLGAPVSLAWLEAGGCRDHDWRGAVLRVTWRGKVAVRRLGGAR